MRRAIAVSLLALSTRFGPAGCTEGPAGTRELKLAYVMAPGGAAHEAAQIFCDMVAAKTGGRVTVKRFPSGQLGSDRELAEALMIGSVDLVIGGMAPVGWYFPQFGAIEAPFAFRDYDHLDRALRGEVGAAIARAFREKKGIEILDWWHRGPRYLTTTSRKVVAPADLAGLKLRVPELPTYIEAWRILGANPTPVTYGEIFMALKQGIVEGQENPLEVIWTSSLYDVQRFIMRTEHLVGAYLVMANARMLERLSPDERRAIGEAAVEAGRRERDLMVAYDAKFAAQLRDKGMEFVDLDREPFRAAVANELPRRMAGTWQPGFFETIVALGGAEGRAGAKPEER